MKELDSDNGIGLIEKKRRGLGKPDIIYVKNFASIGKSEENDERCFHKSSRDIEPFQRSEMPTCRSLETELQEVGKADFLKPYLNIEEVQYIPLHSGQGLKPKDSIDVMEDVNAYMRSSKRILSTNIT